MASIFSRRLIVQGSDPILQVAGDDFERAGAVAVAVAVAVAEGNHIERTIRGENERGRTFHVGNFDGPAGWAPWLARVVDAMDAAREVGRVQSAGGRAVGQTHELLQVR